MRKKLRRTGTRRYFRRSKTADAEAVEAEKKKEAEEKEFKDPTKFAAKKSKAAAKTGKQATQWGIMQASGIADEEIPSFADSMHWLEYFPPLAKRDVALLGCQVDWRRSFITTDVNPFYDSFVRWQFNTLKKLGKIVKAKRYAVYSPIDKQPCADHDRASGEGVGPQEYLLIKMHVLEENFETLECLKPLKGKEVFLAAATLRPETMYGQTNCWILPEGEYGAYELKSKEVFVMGGKSRAEFIVSRTIRRGRETKVVVHDERFGTDGVLGQSAERGVGENLRVADVDDFHDQRDRRGHLGPVGFSG